MTKLHLKYFTLKLTQQINVDSLFDKILAYTGKMTGQQLAEILLECFIDE